MNIKEWYKACNEGWAPRKYDNASREIQLSLKYNPDPKATVRHHLRDTEEQRKYNDEHYELWGFEIDENGNEHFEYGKYIVFVTHEEHLKIHESCEDTNKKRSASMLDKWQQDDYRLKVSSSLSGEKNPMYGKRLSDECKQKLHESIIAYWSVQDNRDKQSNTQKKLWTDERRLERSILLSGENAPMYGKHHTEETKRKISESRVKYIEDHPDCTSGENNSMYGKHHTEESKRKMRESLKSYWTDEKRLEHSILLSGENNPNYGKHLSEETKRKISDAQKGRIAWNKGVALSEDARAKISQSSIGKHGSTKIVADSYRQYKLSGGTLSWNDYQKQYKSIIDSCDNTR